MQNITQETITQRKVHLTSGIPASGKTTYIKEHSERGDIALHRDLFRDYIREFKLSKTYFPVSIEKEWELWMGYCNSALVMNPTNDIWIDQTTLGIGALKKIITSLELRDLEDALILHVFETPINTCLERNSFRKGNTRVPDATMESMFLTFNRQPLTRQTIRAANIPFARKDTIIYHEMGEDDFVC